LVQIGLVGRDFFGSRTQISLFSVLRCSGLVGGEPLSLPGFYRLWSLIVLRGREQVFEQHLPVDPTRIAVGFLTCSFRRYSSSPHHALPAFRVVRFTRGLAEEDDKAFDSRVFRSIGMRLVGTSRTFQVNR